MPILSFFHFSNSTSSMREQESSTMTANSNKNSMQIVPTIKMKIYNYFPITIKMKALKFYNHFLVTIWRTKFIKNPKENLRYKLIFDSSPGLWLEKSLFKVLEHGHIRINQLPNVGEVVLIGNKNTKNRSHHEWEARLDYTHHIDDEIWVDFWVSVKRKKFGNKDWMS